MIKILTWLGSQSKLINGAVIGWFIMGITIGTIIGVILMAGIK